MAECDKEEAPSCPECSSEPKASLARAQCYQLPRTVDDDTGCLARGDGVTCKQDMITRRPNF